MKKIITVIIVFIYVIGSIIVFNLHNLHVKMKFEYIDTAVFLYTHHLL